MVEASSYTRNIVRNRASAVRKAVCEWQKRLPVPMELLGTAPAAQPACKHGLQVLKKVTAELFEISKNMVPPSHPLLGAPASPPQAKKIG